MTGTKNNNGTRGNLPQSAGSTREQDRELLAACLYDHPFAWEKFCDRFLPDMIQVVARTAEDRKLGFSNDQIEDCVRQFFNFLCQDNFRPLQDFSTEGDVRSYLTVLGAAGC